MGPNAGPVALALDARTGRVFVATTSATDRTTGHPIGNGTVAILDTHRGNVLREIPVGGSGNAVAVDETTRRAFVATTAFPPFVRTPVGKIVRVLDTRSGAVVRTVAVGEAPVDIAVDGRTNRVFVATLGPVTGAGAPSRGHVSVLDARTGAIIRTVPVGVSPRTMVVATSTQRVFVLNQDSQSVSTLDARMGTVLRTVTLRHMPCDAGANMPCTAAVDEQTKRVFVASYTGNTAGSGMGAITTLDARTGVVVRSIPVHGRPYAAAVDTRAGHAFITNLGDGMLINGTVLMLNARTGTILRTIAVGGAPIAVAVDERAGRAVVLGTNGGMRAFLNHSRLDLTFANDMVSVLDTRNGTILRTIKVGGDVRAVAIDAQTGHAFVADYASGSVNTFSIE